MSKLPKYNIPGQVHFVTTTVYKKLWLFKEDKYCRIIINNLNFYRKKYKFKLLGYVIMPWHLHLLILLDEKYNNITKVVGDFKSYCARTIIDEINAKRLPSQKEL